LTISGPFSAALIAGAQALGVRLDPFLNFSFFVEIEGLLVGGFSEVTGLESEIEVTAYREGGQNEYIHQLPGPTRYPQNIVLKHGLTINGLLWDWYQSVTQGVIQRKNGTIYLLDTSWIPVVQWDFRAAYPVKWTGPELRAESPGVAIETLSLAHRGIVKPALSF